MDTKEATGTAFGELAELVAWCERAPPGTSVDARALAGILASVAPGRARNATDGRSLPETRPERSEPPTWRVKLWTTPSEVRLSVAEVAEALGRPRSYVYARTGPKAEDPLPHRKLDGALYFTAGELRAWIRDHEEEVHGGPMDPPTRTLEVL